MESQALYVDARYRGRLLGPELEFFTVDRDTLAPRDVLDRLAGLSAFGTNIKPEIAREQVELVVAPTWSLRELRAVLVDLVSEVRAALAPVGVVLLPVALYDTARFTFFDDPRYRRLREVFGEVFWDNACAMTSDQINVGAGDEAEAFALHEAYARHLPLFAALSVASPLRRGRANGVACNRMACYDACVTRYPELTGVPPVIASLAEYRRLVEAQPVLPHPNTFYRYVRPMPHRGVAAELRCLDKQPRLADFIALAALAKAVALAALAGDAAPERAGLAERVAEAQARGPSDPEVCRRALDQLARHLDADERPLVDPLFRRLSEGTASDALLRSVATHGLHGAYARLAAGYLDESHE